MSKKVVGSHSGSIAKASACMGKGTTSAFGKSGKGLKAASNTMPSKMIK